MNEIIEQQDALPVLPNVPTREQIEELERHLAVHPGRIAELPVMHHFAPGLYVRELHMPAGTLATGKTHKTKHFLSVDVGDVTLWTEQGMRRVQAPFKTISQPGAKRVALAHAYTVITTYHPTEETDLVKIEAELIEPENYTLPPMPAAVIEAGAV